MLNFLILELQAAEDAKERVWILGHVLAGWDGSNPLPNPTNLFYQIVDRYSPHVIANIFFGHTHEDQVMIYYANNGTVQTSENALTLGWIWYVHFRAYPSYVELKSSRKTCFGSTRRFYSQDLSCNSTSYLDEAVLTPKSA